MSKCKMSTPRYIHSSLSVSCYLNSYGDVKRPDAVCVSRNAAVAARGGTPHVISTHTRPMGQVCPFAGITFMFCRGEINLIINPWKLYLNPHRIKGASCRPSRTS